MTPALTLSSDADLLKKSDLKQWLSATDFDTKARWKGLVWTLSFFKQDALLAELVNEDAADGSRHYLIKIGDDIQKAQFGSQVVENLIGQAGLNLTKDNVADYLSFYLGFTRGQAGRLFIINNVDDLPLREELTVVLRRNVHSLITPLQALSDREIEGCFLIQNKLFKAKATIEDNGSVLLEPLSILADTLPVQD